MPKIEDKKKLESKQNGRGRPTKYKPEYCQGIIDFFKKEGKPLYKTVTYQGEVKRELIGNLPAFFEAYADEIGVHTDTLLQWCKDYEDFSVAYKRAKDIQRLQFEEKGLSGDLDPAITIFTMKKIFGMKDKVENKIVDEFSDKTDEELDRELEENEAWIAKKK